MEGYLLKHIIWRSYLCFCVNLGSYWVGSSESVSSFSRTVAFGRLVPLATPESAIGEPPPSSSSEDFFSSASLLRASGSNSSSISDDNQKPFHSPDPSQNRPQIPMTWPSGADTGSKGTGRISSGIGSSNKEMTNSEISNLHGISDFSEVYSFNGSVFDPETKGHVQKLKEMDPINFETVLLLMRNLTVNLSSPDFEPIIFIRTGTSEGIYHE